MKELSCARCESTDIRKVADSPVKGKWEMYRCEACNFIWRSYEDLTLIPKNIDYLRERLTYAYPHPESAKTAHDK